MTSSTKRRATFVTSGVLVAVLAAGAGTWALVGTPQESSAQEQPAPQRTTTEVTRGDLTDTKTYAGALGYGKPVALTGTAQGTLTWLPAPGSTVHRDQPLYAVDEEPVRSMHGLVPLWRPLARKVRGADVAQLNQNLAALGYDVALDDVFGPRTERAVKRWQKDRSIPVTGVIDAQQVAFVDGDVRVDSVTGQLGRPAAGDVLNLTSTSRVVTASVPPSDAERLAVGTDVTVTVNGAGTPVPGKVVDTAPKKTDSGSDAVQVTIAFDAGDRKLPAAGSAQVVAKGQSESGVLTVPVSAIVAGPDGGFAVDVVRKGGTTRRVDVRVGFVAQGRAVVDGDVREGDRVVVPS